jgi:hypothetical protein
VLEISWQAKQLLACQEELLLHASGGSECMLRCRFPLYHLTTSNILDHIKKIKIFTTAKTGWSHGYWNHYWREQTITEIENWCRVAVLLPSLQFMRLYTSELSRITKTHSENEYSGTVVHQWCWSCSWVSAVCGSGLCCWCFWGICWVNLLH